MCPSVCIAIRVLEQDCEFGVGNQVKEYKADKNKTETNKKYVYNVRYQNPKLNI